MPKLNRKATLARRRCILALAKQFPDTPTAIIARIFGLHPVSVSDLLHDAGLSRRKRSLTQETILQLRAQTPAMPAVEIAQRVGVSRERVRQILAKQHLPTTFRQRRRCPCGALARPSRPHCSDECKALAQQQRHAKTLIAIICEVCGGKKLLSRKHLAWTTQYGRSTGRFCSTACRLEWLTKVYGPRLGREHGFVAHPEHMAKPRRETHCNHGHSLDDAYTYQRRGGIQRQCRACSQIVRKARYQRDKAQLAAGSP